MSALDPANITDKINKYTGYQFSEFRLFTIEKAGHFLRSIVVQSVSIPIIFIKPGTYDLGGGKQKTAFGAGTVYFRHGAKSEPGNSDDLRRSFEKRLEVIRDTWLNNVRQVIEAPLGATIFTIPPNTYNSTPQIGIPQAMRIVDSPEALLINVKEEDILKIAPYDYRSLTNILRERYTNFVVNAEYHKLRKSLENDIKYCRIRYLDPKKPNSSKKCFYSADIIAKFDTHYLIEQCA